MAHELSLLACRKKERWRERVTNMKAVILEILNFLIV